VPLSLLWRRLGVLASHPRGAAVVALAVCFVWSTSFVVTKQLYRYGIGPLTLTGVRFGLAAVVLLPLWLRHHRGAARRSGVAVPVRAVILLGAAGYALNPAGYNGGFASLDASWVGVLLGVNNNLPAARATELARTTASALPQGSPTLAVTERIRRHRS
jgi:drug/metabolite transporter (DMT)-like permease